VLVNADVRVSAYQGHGFVITELRPAASGCNLLWSRPNAPLQDLTEAIEPGPAIEQFDESVFAGGWFGMFPLAGIPGQTDTDVAMHGEIPRVVWDITNVSATSVACRTRTPSGFDVERMIELDGPTARVSTKARNRSGIARVITWGEHPCFDGAVFAGGRVSAAVCKAFITPEASDAAATRFTPGPRFEWPTALRADGACDDVTRIPEHADGRHDHVSATLTGAVIEVSAPQLAGRIRVQVDLATTPELLLWQHFRPASSPWDGDVFALEVCSAPGRTLDDARQTGAATVIEPDSITAWTLSVQWVQD